MNVWLNPDGTRNRESRPYVSREELANSVYLYDPNGPGFHYGLYQSAHPSCGYWLDIYNQYPSKTPSEVVDSSGRLHLVRPTYWKHGYKYEPLLRHTRPS